MAYEAGMGIPVIASGNGDGFMGGGGIGGLLIGALLAGGLGGFGGLGRNGFGNCGNGGNEAGEARYEGLSSQIAAIQGQMDSNCTLAGISNLQNLVLQDGIVTNQAVAGLGASLENTRFTTLTGINDLGRDFITAINQQTLQQLNSANLLNTTMLQGFNEIGRDTSNSTNQIIAGQTAMSAQMAACCCDLKQAISADGQATRALINDIRLAEIQGQLTDAKLQISNSNQTSTLLAALGNGCNNRCNNHNIV